MAISISGAKPEEHEEAAAREGDADSEDWGEVDWLAAELLQYVGHVVVLEEADGCDTRRAGFEAGGGIG
jgi:hypothetical protein